MKNQKNLAPCLLLSSAALLSACSSGSSSSSGSSTIFKPSAVAPVVNAALPAAYQATNVTVSSIPRKVKTGLPGVTYRGSYQKFFKDGPGLLPGQKAPVKRTPLTTVTVTNTNAALAATNIGYLFSNSFNDINNGSVEWQGYVNNQVVQIDERMHDGPMSAAMSCLANTAKPYTIDLSAIDPMMNFTLGQLQCYGTMGNDPSGNAGGMAFGQQGSTCQVVAPAPTPGPSPVADSTPTPFTPGNTAGGCSFSLWLTLSSNFSTNGGFIVYANLQNAGSTTTAAPEYVDALSMAYSPAAVTTGNTVQVTRLRAVPSLNMFEMYYASNEAGITNAQAQHWSYLGAGFRMISDGVHIYSDGKVYDQGNSNTWLSFNVCLNASDNSVANIGDSTILADCNALANSFSLSTSGTAQLTYYELTGTSTGASIPGPEAQSSQTPPSTAFANLIVPAANVTSASSSASSGFNGN